MGTRSPDPSQSKIRILLADDHHNVRRQLRVRLSREQDLEVIGEAETSQQVMQSTIIAKPRIVLIDPMMRDGLGLQSLRQIAARAPQTALVVLTACADTALRMELRQIGVRQIFDKGIESRRLLILLREIGREQSP